MKCIFSILLGVCLPITAHAGVNLVVNGDFEQPV